MATLKEAREKAGLTQAELAELASTTQPQIRRLESGERTLSKAWAIRLSPHLNVSPEELVFGAASEPAAAPAQDSPPNYRPPPIIMSRELTIPVYSSAEGTSENGSLIISTEPMEYVPRPFTLENVKDAYAIVIEGESMVPAYEPGDIAWVNPMLSARRDHDVILYGMDDRRGETRAIIKRMVSYTDTAWTVRQWNPSEMFTVDRGVWRTCHRVVGKLAKR